MAYIILDTCTKDNECIQACPVDCIHPKPEEPNYEETAQLYVNSEECIDCGACVPVCPTDSIKPIEELTAEQMAAVAINAAFYGVN